jgi:hypothetical protein
MFERRILWDLSARNRTVFPETESTGMSPRWFSRLIILIYVVVGGFVAWDHGYINLAWLRTLGSALLAILLWWLILLGVNLHIHA